MLHLFRKWSEVQILYRRMWCWRTGVENRKSKAGEAVLPVLRSVSLFLLGLLGVLLILLTLLVIAAEAARIICLGPAEKKQQQPMQNSPADFRRSSQANIRVSAI